MYRHSLASVARSQGNFQSWAGKLDGELFFLERGLQAASQRVPEGEGPALLPQLHWEGMGTDREREGKVGKGQVIVLPSCSPEMKAPPVISQPSSTVGGVFGRDIECGGLRGPRLSQPPLTYTAGLRHGAEGCQFTPHSTFDVPQ